MKQDTQEIIVRFIMSLMFVIGLAGTAVLIKLLIDLA